MEKSKLVTEIITLKVGDQSLIIDMHNPILIAYLEYQSKGSTQKIYTQAIGIGNIFKQHISYNLELASTL